MVRNKYGPGGCECDCCDRHRLPPNNPANIAFMAYTYNFTGIASTFVNDQYFRLSLTQILENRYIYSGSGLFVTGSTTLYIEPISPVDANLVSVEGGSARFYPGDVIGVPTLGIRAYVRAQVTVSPLRVVEYFVDTDNVWWQRSLSAGAAFNHPGLVSILRIVIREPNNPFG